MFTTLQSKLMFLLTALVFTLFSSMALAGPKAYVGNFKDSTVSVIDTTTNKVVSTIPVAAGPHGMGITLDGRWLYVSGDTSSVLNLIDTATDRVVKTIEVGKSPHGVTLTPDGKLLLVAVNGEDRIVFIDTATQTVVGSVGVAKPHTIAIRPDGKEAYISSQEPGHFALAIINLAKRAVSRTIPLDKTPRDLEFAYTGKAVYFTEAGISVVEVLDPITDKIVAEIPTGVSPHFVKFFQNTKFGMVVVQGPGELLLFDPERNKPAGSIKVGMQPHWLTVLGNGKTAYVTNEGSNDVTVVDLMSSKTTTIPVGNAPRKVVVQPVSGDPKVLISNFTFNPQEAVIAPGETITWSNDDGAPHAIAFKDGAAGSETLFPGKKFSRTFDRPGTYEYYCSIHAYMTGRIIVKPI
jgi:YVTN family beta-propeller protein